MKEYFPERLDSQTVRQGLLSIRNSQIELLKQLKIETQQLKKVAPRLIPAAESSTTQSRAKTNEALVHSTQSVVSEEKRNLTGAHLPLQKAPSYGSIGERQAQSQLSYLKEQNKKLAQTVQKLLSSRSGDKQRYRQLESYLYFSQKLTLLLIDQFSNESSIAQVKRCLEHDLQLNKDIYAKYTDSNHHLILQLLKDRQATQQTKQLPANTETAKERDLVLQLAQLKDQFALLLKTSHQQTDNKINIDHENSRLREQNEALIIKCEEMQKKINTLDSDNKELAFCWERELNQRKKLMEQLQKMRRKAATEEKEKMVCSTHKDLQNKLSSAQKLLKDKEANQAITLENVKKLTEAVAILSEQNLLLKKDLKMMDERKEQMQKQEHNNLRQVESEMKTKILQQATMLRNYEQQIYDLRNHLAQVKKNQQMLIHAQVRQKENDVVNQEIYWRKVQVIKNNSTVQHLWQVKNAQYANLSELLRFLREGSSRRP